MLIHSINILVLVLSLEYYSLCHAAPSSIQRLSLCRSTMYGVVNHSFIHLLTLTSNDNSHIGTDSCHFTAKRELLCTSHPVEQESKMKATVRSGRVLPLLMMLV